MALDYVKEVYLGRGGKSAGESDSQSTRTFLIRTTTRLENDQTVFAQASSQLPSWRSPHPDNFYLKARSLAIAHYQGSPIHWLVTVEYDSRPLDKKEQERQEVANPLDREPSVEWESVQYEQVAEKDRDGNAILNSAGVAPDPPPLVPASRWVIKVSANVASVPEWVLESNNRINDAEVTVGGRACATETLMIQGIRISDEQEENDVTYRVISFELHYREDGWALELLDQGYEELSGGNLTPILVSGDRPASPQLLNGSGAKLADPVSASDAVFLTFNVHKTIDMTQFPGVT